MRSVAEKISAAVRISVAVKITTVELRILTVRIRLDCYDVLKHDSMIVNVVVVNAKMFLLYRISK